MTYQDMSRLRGAQAGDRAFLRFCTPALSERRSADHEVLVARARPLLGGAKHSVVATRHGPVDCYVFEPEKQPARGSVLIVHGWTSEASFMGVFAEQLRRAGFRAVAFDQPGHGRSTIRQASLVDCTRVLIDVAAAMGPFQSVLAHSMGCLASLMAGSGGAPFGPGHPFERYVLISSPNRFSDVTGEHADVLGLDMDAKRQFERRVARAMCRPLPEVRADRLLAAIDAPALLLHARDDHEVLPARSEEIAAMCPKAELTLMDGVGHRLILSTPFAIRTAIGYLTAR